MNLPEMKDLEVLGQIGGGESGKVFGAKNEENTQFAVKIFEGMAINRTVLSKMAERLKEGDWPEGVVPLESIDFQGRPACLVMPFLGDMVDVEDEETKWNPRSLQYEIDEHPGENTWVLVKAIAKALSEMHERRVPHGNLKPGNVFLDQEGGVKLADWALGNMPGISHFDFTDALLYQAPEQLLRPEGYLEEEAYRWDVFAFGVLSYRLLTGSFPRCDENFSSVAPPQGETRMEGIQAELSVIAKNLQGQEEVDWPAEAQNALEAGYRKWIDSCLLLEPFRRPVSMIDVSRGFAQVEFEVGEEEIRENLMDQRRRSERNGRRLAFFGGMVTAACLVFVGLWLLTRNQLITEQMEREHERVNLTGQALGAIDQMNDALEAQKLAEQEMEYQREVGLARLEASRLIGDRLFDWALEKGHRRLPPLDGRDLRLKRLERFYEDFLRRSESIKSLDEEMARARLQLAEVSLASGDADEAEKRLDTAIQSWTNLTLDGETKLRLARNALLLALLKQEKDQEGTADAFKAARSALENVPQTAVDGQRLRQLLAILDFHEARLLASQGEEVKALEQLLLATRSLNELADERPESAVLRSELAACYLSSATVLEGMGKLGDAREVRAQAAEEMVSLLKENPKDMDIRLDLAGCYGAMAESLVLAGDITAASQFSEQAMKLLEQVLQARPESTIAATRKAAQLGLQAGLLRDQGESEKALEAFEKGIQLLERQGSNSNPMVQYRLALLWWQKGRMLGFSGKKKEEITLLGKARETLRELETESKIDGDGPRIEELQRSSAYLLSDYAHALELAGNDEKAKEIYREATALWEALLKSRPQSEEFKEGLEWIRQRAEGV